MRPDKNIRLEMTPNEGRAVLKWLGNCIGSEEIEDVYYRLQDALKKREPKIAEETD